MLNFTSYQKHANVKWTIIFSHLVLKIFQENLSRWEWFYTSCTGRCIWRLNPVPLPTKMLWHLLPWDGMFALGGNAHHKYLIWRELTEFSLACLWIRKSAYGKQTIIICGLYSCLFCKWQGMVLLWNSHVWVLFLALSFIH